MRIFLTKMLHYKKALPPHGASIVVAGTAKNSHLGSLSLKWFSIAGHLNSSI
jgi:hypothetical protein